MGVLDGARTEGAEAGAAEIGGRARPAVGDGERIMVIEDDPDVHDVTTVALKKLGYEIIDGGDGTEALRIGYDQEEKLICCSPTWCFPMAIPGPNWRRHWQRNGVR